MMIVSYLLYGEKYEARRKMLKSFAADRPNTTYLLSWLLQFGGSAELLEPESLREKILEAAQGLVNIYENGG